MSLKAASFDIVIPVFNEALNINLLHQRLGAVLSEKYADLACRIIFVDDGSSDATFAHLRTLQKADSRVIALRLSRNFGHHVAIEAGLRFADADWVALMDGDLQDEPENLPLLTDKMNENFDLVYTIRKERTDKLFRRLSSNFFWRWIRWSSGLDIPKNQAMLRVFNRKVLDALNEFPEQRKFYAGLFAYIGFATHQIQVQHAKRHAGDSKYSISKLIQLAMNASFSYSDKPILLVNTVAFLLIAIASPSLIFGFFTGLNGLWMIVFVMFFCTGLTLRMLGVLALYIFRAYQQSLQRPNYFVKEILGR